MERISRDEYLMEAAELVARRGTCSRAQVGVVFAREGRVVATGYNGAPPGIDHCVHESAYVSRSMDEPVPEWLWELWDKMQENPDVMVVGHIQKNTSYHWDGQKLTVAPGKTTAPGCTVVSHAERNGISFAAREGIRLGGTDVFCTHAPCEDCAKSLLSAGIQTLHFKTPYRLTAGVELLDKAGIEIFDNGALLL